MVTPGLETMPLGLCDRYKNTKTGASYLT